VRNITEEPWERPAGVPVPSLQDVGVLTRLAAELDYRVAELGYRVAELDRWRMEFRQMRDSASGFNVRRKEPNYPGSNTLVEPRRSPFPARKR
jgi:hypothetical protein